MKRRWVCIIKRIFSVAAVGHRRLLWCNLQSCPDPVWAITSNQLTTVSVPYTKSVHLLTSIAQSASQWSICSDTSDVEDSEISLSLDVADAGPPTSTDDDDDDDDNDLESFWQQLNAARSTALERMKFSSWASPDHSNEKPSTTNHFNQVVTVDVSPSPRPYSVKPKSSQNLSKIYVAV